MKNWDFDSLRTARPLQPSRRRSLNGGSPVRLVLGLAAIALGAVFFLDNLYWIDAKPVLRYWPAALVLALGAASLYQARRFTLGVGLWFVAGSWLLLDALRWIDLDFWEVVIPLGLVLLGVQLLTRSLSRRPAETDPGLTSITGDAGDSAKLGDAGKSGSDESSLSAFAIMAGVRRASHSQTLRRVDAMAIMGGVEIDLTQAAPPAGSAIEIDASTIWGGIEIWVPAGWVVDLRPVALMAGVEDQTAHGRPSGSPTPLDATRPRVIVRGFALMGAIEVKNRLVPA